MGKTICKELKEENMSNIYAGIVTYNPDLLRLKDNISAIQKQVPFVIIFDNGSANFEDIQKITLEFPNVKVLISKSNIGIAAALNKLMQWGSENGYGWMLSLDQDSVCAEDYVSSMVHYFSVEKNIGIVAPVILDRNIGIVGHNPASEYAHVNTCITSGSFSRISAWEKIGGYDESMFIDSVDFEYCYRMRKFGYGVIQVKNVHLLHEIGKSEKRRFIAWTVDVKNHSAFRKYYMARNNVYYPLKHRLWLHFLRGNVRNLQMTIIVLLYEDDKKKKIKSILRGWKDGFRQKGI